jgi:Domain of unknown function (DUF1330)
MNAIIEFPSEEAVRAGYNDPEYRAVMPLRLRSVSDCSMIIVKQFAEHPDGLSSGVRQSHGARFLQQGSSEDRPFNP